MDGEDARAGPREGCPQLGAKIEAVGFGVGEDQDGLGARLAGQGFEGGKLGLLCVAGVSGAWIVVDGLEEDVGVVGPPVDEQLFAKRQVIDDLLARDDVAGVAGDRLVDRGKNGAHATAGVEGNYQ